MPFVEFKGVYKAYPNSKKTEMKVVLKDINFFIEKNEFVCIIGPSGCGKTTLLNMLAGFEKPLAGQIFYKGEEVKGPSPEKAVVFQEFSLLPWLDVQKNVEFSLIPKLKPDDRKKVADKYIEMVGLSAFKNHRPSSLSGGMKQRVAIARTLAMESELLLMDEPFSSLDEHTRRHLDHELLNIWNKEKRTVLFITHNIDEALLLGTRIILLSASPGKVAMEWNPDKGMDPRSQEYLTLKEDIIERMDRFINDAGKEK